MTYKAIASNSSLVEKKLLFCVNNKNRLLLILSLTLLIMPKLQWSGAWRTETETSMPYSVISQCSFDKATLLQTNGLFSKEKLRRNKLKCGRGMSVYIRCLHVSIRYFSQYNLWVKFRGFIVNVTLKNCFKIAFLLYNNTKYYYNQ